MDLSVMSPMDYYTGEAKEKHERLTREHFDALLKASGVNEDASRQAAANYRAQLAVIDALNRKIGKYKVLRGFMIAALVILGIFTVIPQLMEDWHPAVRIVIPIACIALFVTVLLLILLKVNKIIRHYDILEDGEQVKARELLDIANAILAPLVALFRDEDTFRLIEKTLPSVKFERRLSTELVEDMNANYDYIDYGGENSSSLETVSGRISGNPFFFDRVLAQRMGSETYHGTLTIHWTTTYRDNNGRIQTRHHTQTLHASVTKPKPYYGITTYLNYGNQAAPDLSFSRDGDHVEDLSEKKLKRLIDKGEDKIAQKARDSLEDGGNFTEMSNTKFEVLFDALDRDHEQQFRLMFTPLAQSDMIKLITSETGYGDDFDFIKRKRHNVIMSEHAQTWAMGTGVSNFISYDIDILRDNFIAFNTGYFKSVYFDFAPLLTIPAYQHAPVPSMAQPPRGRNYSHKEYETVANSIGRRRFAHPDTATDIILKTEHVATYGSIDRVGVTAYSWGGIPRVDVIPTLGGDGRIHGVPVHWIEYYPLAQRSEIEITRVDEVGDEELDKKKTALSAIADLGDIGYKHGLLARITSSGGAQLDTLRQILITNNKPI